MTIFFTDAYTDKPRTKRGRLEHEVERIKCLLWASPGDGELRQMLEEAEAELQAFEREAAS